MTKMNRNYLIATAAAALFAAVAATPATAECLGNHQASSETTEQGTTAMTVPAPQKDTAAAADATEDPEEVVDEIVENAEPANDGSGETHASTGKAEPTENWFGCSPDSEDGACEDMTPDTAPEASADTPESEDTVGDTAMADDECSSSG